MKPAIIKQRYDALKSERKTIEQTWQEIERYVCPFRGNFFSDMNSEHEQDTHRIDHYDSTAIYSAKALKSHIHGMLISPATKWFGLRYRTDDLNEDQEARMWLEDTEERVYAALVQSNFNVKTAEFLYDMVTYGEGHIVEEVEDEVNWKGISFKSVGVRDAFFETDHNDQMLRFYRRLQWTPLQVFEKFGDDTPDDIKEQVEDPSSIDTKHEIIMCIYRRNEGDYVDDDLVIPSKREYGKKYIRHSDAAMLGDEGGYYEMPAFYALWDTTSNSKHGNSPAMTCLADVINANEFLKIQRESEAMACAPPILTTDRNLLGDLQLKARGLSVVRDINNIREFVTGARFEVSEHTMDGFRASIERAFLMDSLQLKESPAMTATEVQARYDLMMKNISHTLGSLQSNFLDKTVVRTVNLLFRAGRLKPMPDIVKQSQDEFDITYTGPMPRAQKREDVMSTRAWLQDTAALIAIQKDAGLYPNVMDIPDFDKIERDLGAQAGVPAKYMRSQSDVEKDRKARAEAEAKAQKIADMQGQGDAMQSVGAGAEALKNNPEAAGAMEEGAM